MSFAHEPMPVKRLTGKLIDIEAARVVPDDIIGAISYRMDRDEFRKEEVIRAAMKVAAFGETTTGVWFAFPETWKEMLRQRLRDRYPWLKRVIREPRMGRHCKAVRTFEKVCPHVGQGMMPSRDDCIEFVVMDEMPRFDRVPDSAPYP